MTIGENIKKYRLQAGLTQDKLGESIGVTGKAVSAWEIGAKMPRMTTIERLADFFGVSKSRLIENADVISAVTKVPIVGRVAAGQGCFAESDIEGYEPIPTDMLSPDEQFICLNVKGDSMSPKIESGDKLLVRLQPSVDSGDYAVVIIDGEDGVVKKVCYSDDRIELISENPYYPPRVFEGSDVTRIQVVGLVRRVIREL